MSKQKVKKEIDIEKDTSEIVAIRDEIYSKIKIVVKGMSNENGMIKAKTLLRLLRNNFF
jgi:hypothetical protein